MRFHIVGLPWSETIRIHDRCAYTAKARRLADMLYSRGHDVFLYAGERNEASCTEHIPVVSRADIAGWWPGWDPEREPARPNVFDVGTPWWGTMNVRAAHAIRARMQKGDFLCVNQGVAQESLVRLLPCTPSTRRPESADMMRAVETGIGYNGIIADTFHVFESRAHRSYVHGFHRDHTGRPFDTVIPNAFDPADLSYSGKKDDYLLFMGRMDRRCKGLEIVEQIARVTGKKVICAGQGDYPWFEGAEFVGLTLGKDKADLLAKATAVLVPSLYLEPFGGVAVEAMMSGTPVITANWGAFPETVTDGVTGFLCDTLNDYVCAVRECYETFTERNYSEIRGTTVQRFGTARVGLMYERYFGRLQTLDEDGFFAR